MNGKCYKNVVIAFDNDKPGQEASSLLLKALYKIGMPCVQFDYEQLKGNHKDINEYLNDNKEELREVCNRMALEANNKAIETRNDNKEANTLEKEKDAHTANMSAKALEIENMLKSSNMVNYIIDKYPIDIKTHKKIYKSGFTNLDNETGGLYTGLYILGAVSSLGKTTFLLNIADNLARQGEHVLFFSLEMSRIELFTKSLARIISTYQSASERVNSISATDIRRRNFDENGKEASDESKARNEYLTNIAPNMTIVECDFETTIEDIRNTVTKYIEINNVKPVVFVDYIQIMAPRDPHMTERQNADDIVKGLKILQSKNDLLVFAVSSFNRNSYLSPIDYESFKDSGGIEYTADVLWGLQLEDVNGEYKNDTLKRKALKEAKREKPRHIELVCVKNRGGVANYSLKYIYYSNCDLFMEGTHKEEYTSFNVKRQFKR